MCGVVGAPEQVAEQGQQRVASKSIRVLHTPTTVGGNPQQLAKAERAIGLDSQSIALEQNFLNYEVDQVVWTSRDGRLMRELKKLRLIWQALSYDVIHLDFGSTIASPAVPPTEAARGLKRVLWWLYWIYGAVLEWFELCLYGLWRKPVFITFQGDDIRQGDFCRQNFQISIAGEAAHYAPTTDAHKRHRVRRLERFATKMYALNPDLLHVLPADAEFLPYANVDIRRWLPVSTNNSRLRIMHAPSHRGKKGTEYILDAVDRLQREGFSFDFQLIEGISHQETKDHYAQADLLIDQLLAGWYGGLAVELMALGKPVICYIRQGDLKFLPADMRRDLPIISAEPGTIYDVLRHSLNMPREELQQIGCQSRAYVEKWHDPLQIARRLKRDYEQAVGRNS